MCIRDSSYTVLGKEETGGKDMLELHHVEKLFLGDKGIHDITITFQSGEIYGILAVSYTHLLFFNKTVEFLLFFLGIF